MGFIERSQIMNRNIRKLWGSINREHPIKQTEALFNFEYHSDFRGKYRKVDLGPLYSKE